VSHVPCPTIQSKPGVDEFADMPLPIIPTRATAASAMAFVERMKRWVKKAEDACPYEYIVSKGQLVVDTLASGPSGVVLVEDESTAGERFLEWIVKESGPDRLVARELVDRARAGTSAVPVEQMALARFYGEERVVCNRDGVVEGCGLQSQVVSLGPWPRVPAWKEPTGALSERERQLVQAMRQAAKRASADDGDYAEEFIVSNMDTFMTRAAEAEAAKAQALEEVRGLREQLMRSEEALAAMRQARETAELAVGQWRDYAQRVRAAYDQSQQQQAAAVQETEAARLAVQQADGALAAVREELVQERAQREALERERDELVEDLARASARLALLSVRLSCFIVYEDATDLPAPATAAAGATRSSGRRQEQQRRRRRRPVGFRLGKKVARGSDRGMEDSGAYVYEPWGVGADGAHGGLKLDRDARWAPVRDGREVVAKWADGFMIDDLEVDGAGKLESAHYNSLIKHTKYVELQE
jgi:hypothetical protein